MDRKTLIKNRHQLLLEKRLVSNTPQQEDEFENLVEKEDGFINSSKEESVDPSFFEGIKGQKL